MKNQEWRRGFLLNLAAGTFAVFFFFEIFLKSFIFYNRDTNIHFQYKKIPYIIPSKKSYMDYKRGFSKGALVLLGIIEVIDRSAASAYAFSSLNQFTMMNGPHLAPQLVFC